MQEPPPLVTGPSSASALPSPNPPSGFRKRALAVLCVDDDECIVSTIVHVLKSKGMQAEGATDGQTAVTLISADLARFDIVMTDHRMPLMDGLELVARLKDLGYKGGLVVHSSPLCQRDQIAYEALGIRSFLPKPSDLMVIWETVEAASRKSS